MIADIIQNNHFHSKIKLSEELKWFDEYGYIPPQKCLQQSN
jgi:hypothetical protein